MRLKPSAPLSPMPPRDLEFVKAAIPRIREYLKQNGFKVELFHVETWTELEIRKIDSAIELQKE